VTRLRTARSLEEAAALLKSPDFDPKHEAIVEGGPALAAGEPAGTVAVLEYGFAARRLSVESERPAYLATSETHYPGWRAYVDGRRRRSTTPTGVSRVSGAGGSTRFSCDSRRRLFWWAAAASALGWICGAD